MGDQHTRSGSLFSLGQVPPDALPDFLLRIHRQQSLKKSTPRLSQILEAWFDLCGDAEDGIVDRDALCAELKITRPGLLHNLKKLEELGMLTKANYRHDNKRRSVVVYTLAIPDLPVPTADDMPDLFDEDILDISDADTASLEERDALQQMIRHPDSVTCAPTSAKKTTFKGERLTVFTLAPALNIGRQGAVTSKTTRIWRGTRSFEVTVRAITGHRIPNVEDLRPLVVAWTLARDQLPHMGENMPSHPVFVMKLTTICEHLGFKNPTANHKRQTFDRIRRFRSSEWQLTDDRYNVLRSFRNDGVLERDKYMSFIADLEVVSTVAAHGKTPETIAITFHPSFTPVLTDMERSLTLHKEFIQGKYREFDQLIYQWCRTSVQHNHEPLEYALERVHREAHPSATMVQFRAGLERMTKDRRYERIPDAGYPIILIPGYMLAFDFAKGSMVASARGDDLHLGTTSKHALASQQKKRIAGAGGGGMQHPKTSSPTMRPEPVADHRTGESSDAYGLRRISECLDMFKNEDQS